MELIDFNTIGLAGAIAFSVWLLYKTEILQALSKKVLSSIGSADHSNRVKKLEDFKYEAENNHWHDIENLQAGQERLERAFNEHRRDVNSKLDQYGNRLTRVETKLGNGH